MKIRAKLRWAVAFALTVAACGGTVVTDTTTTTPTELQVVLSDHADAVRESLQDLSLDLSNTTVAENVDLSMAWTDLESDLYSVVNDLVRDPDSVDTEGVQRRVESFGVMVTEANGVDMPVDSWEHFLASFTSFVEVCGSA